MEKHASYNFSFITPLSNDNAVRNEADQGNTPSLIKIHQYLRPCYYAMHVCQFVLYLYLYDLIILDLFHLIFYTFRRFSLSIVISIEGFVVVTQNSTCTNSRGKLRKNKWKTFFTKYCLNFFLIIVYTRITIATCNEYHLLYLLKSVLSLYELTWKIQAKQMLNLFFYKILHNIPLNNVLHQYNESNLQRVPSALSILKSDLSLFKYIFVY